MENPSSKSLNILEKSTPPAPKNEYEPGKFKALSRAKVAAVHELIVGMKHIVVEPFSIDLLSNEVLAGYVDAAEEYIIHSGKHAGIKACILRFKDVVLGDEAYVDLKRTFSENFEIEIKHPTIDDERSWIFKSETDTASLYSFMGRIFFETDGVDTFLERAVLLESVPPCTDEELADMFPEALNIINFTTDSLVKDVVIVETKSETDRDVLLKQCHGSRIGERVICAHLVGKRVGKLQEKSRDHNKRELTGRVLMDDTRMEMVKQYVRAKEETESLLQSTDLTGYQKLLRTMELRKIWEPRQLSLFYDARHRFDHDVPFPDGEVDVPEKMRRFVWGEGIFEKIEERREETRKQVEEFRRTGALQVSKRKLEAKYEGPPAKFARGRGVFVSRRSRGSNLRGRTVSAGGRGELGHSVSAGGRGVRGHSMGGVGPGARDFYQPPRMDPMMHHRGHMPPDMRDRGGMPPREMAPHRHMPPVGTIATEMMDLKDRIIELSAQVSEHEMRMQPPMSRGRGRPSWRREPHY